MICRRDRAAAAVLELAGAAAVLIPQCVPPARCRRWVEGVYRARAQWTADFGGEQFCLGRAFYTHLEEGKSDAYFANPAVSDALVEEHCPGLQQAMRDLLAEIVAARVVQRRGWCGPGVHVFPPREPVATRGGAVHFDTEGLPTRHARAAVTAVLMLQAPPSGGGLEVWDVLYAGHDHPTAQELASPSAVVTSAPGDVVVIDSYRLHQIQAWRDERDRISATIHAADVGGGVWESWF